MAEGERFHEAIEGGLPLIGSPVKQVKTPRYVNARLRDQGSDLKMVPVELQEGEITPFFAALRASDRARGCSSTIPYKRQVFAHMDATTSTANRLGVVNTVRREAGGALVGCMTDGEAMLGAIQAKGVDPTGAIGLVVGAGGGAGRAIADSLASHGATRIELRDPNREQIARTFETLSASFRHTEFIVSPTDGPWDIVINASPLGSSDHDPLPVRADLLGNCLVVADAVTARDETELVLLARANGSVTVSGLEMALAQIDLQMRHWKLDR